MVAPRTVERVIALRVEVQNHQGIFHFGRDHGGMRSKSRHTDTLLGNGLESVARARPSCTSADPCQVVLPNVAMQK